MPVRLRERRGALAVRQVPVRLEGPRPVVRPLAPGRLARRLLRRTPHASSTSFSRLSLGLAWGRWADKVLAVKAELAELADLLRPGAAVNLLVDSLQLRQRNHQAVRVARVDREVST